MTTITIRYDNETQRITQTYWRNGSPEWANEQRDGTTITTTETTQQTRTDALNSALNGVEAGTDYDPDTESAVGKLCYDPKSDELYAEVEIRPLPL
jgi:hypothetical protein